MCLESNYDHLTGCKKKLWLMFVCIAGSVHVLLMAWVRWPAHEQVKSNIWKHFNVSRPSRDQNQSCYSGHGYYMCNLASTRITMTIYQCNSLRTVKRQRLCIWDNCFPKSGKTVWDIHKPKTLRLWLNCSAHTWWLLDDTRCVTDRTGEVTLFLSEVPLEVACGLNKTGPKQE